MIRACGHRVVEHTADQILEAWGPTRAACLEQTAAGFVASFVTLPPPSGSGASRAASVVLDGADDAGLLLALLDEIVFLLDTQNVVPAGVQVDDHGGHVDVRLDLIDLATTEPVGPAPKGISHSGLTLCTDGRRWTARALIDV